MTQGQYPLLDNPFWHALSGDHARHSAGGAQARRYARGFSPIVAFADPGQPDFAALAPHCDLGEQLYCDSWSGAAPPGWRVDAETTMFRMVWDGPAPADDAAPDAVALGPQHAAQALELATLTRPGPFGIRTIELGEYFGYFDGGRLVAMAGERLSAAGLREVSGICTHPDFQGRGHARALAQKLIRRQALRGETSFLHVMRANEMAHHLYLRMGFRDYRESVVRVISRTA
ncbi:GNAT family N-acetyltransferase [Rugamonas sp.]|uniref:GNAT family N-acetyltransferase n=1 Tax=Rugamonas sp. TaxID=1926287 RepID=UPI0025F0B6E1|nr:GNAT family N-acetyltransferase [Rugamonas sp.]